VASLCLFLGLGSLWAWWHANPGAMLFCAAAGVACAGIQVQRFCAGVLHAFEEFREENSARILQGTLFAGLVVAGVGWGGMQVAGVLGLLAASHIAAALFLLGALQRRWQCLSWRLTILQAKDWLKEAVPLGLGDVVRGLTGQVDTILLGLMQPAAVVGI